MPDDYIAPFRKLTSVQLLTILIEGEARGQGVEGRIAVGCTARNRVKITGKLYRDIILQKSQFSCFNEDDPNLAYCLGIIPAIQGSAHRENRWISMGVVTDALTDITKGATHYHHKDCKPWWAPKMKFIKQIGAHFFYEEFGFH